MPTAVRSHAKINLGLYIGAPRPDGFHSLVTVYQTLELHDLVSVKVRLGSEAISIHLTSNDPRVPTDERNTAWKMIHLALEELGLTADVEIHIEKRLPIQGGLGAGSGNAVAALVGLETALGVGMHDEDGFPALGQLSLARWGEKRGAGSPLAGPAGLMAQWRARRLQLAAQVGSDVPLFLIGGAVLGLDRGQQVYPLPDLEPTWCVLVTPAAGVSTPQAFRDWDGLCEREGLTAEASHDKLNKLSRAYASAFAEAIPKGRSGAGSSGVLASKSQDKDLAGPVESALVRTGISSWIQNDFEGVVFPQHPSLAEIKRILAGSSTPEASLHASLSGSGSALFGLYLTQRDAEAASARVQQQFQDVEVRITRTLPRTAYWSQMVL